jgi:NADH-quinone oxidoreductase subunit C
MSKPTKAISELFTGRFGDRVTVGETLGGIVTIEVDIDAWLEVCRALRDEEDFCYEQLTDLCGVDYLSYGQSEWDTAGASTEGFGRGVEGMGPGRFDWADRPGTNERRSTCSELCSKVTPICAGS